MYSGTSGAVCQIHAGSKTVRATSASVEPAAIWLVRYLRAHAAAPERKREVRTRTPLAPLPSVASDAAEAYVLAIDMTTVD